MAKQFLVRVARLIDQNRYEDAIREAEAGMTQIGVEMNELEIQRRDLANLRDAAKTIMEYMGSAVTRVRATTRQEQGGPKLPGEEITTAADSLLVNGKAKITAEEVRQELEHRGIDTSVVRHPTSVISTVLSRDKRFFKVGMGEFRRASQPSPSIADIKLTTPITAS